MKTETYIKAHQIEAKLEYAVKMGYITLQTAEKNIFFDAYKETFNKELTRSEKACPHCMIQVVRRFWTEYAKFKASPQGRKTDKELDGEEKR